jgi:hypothetical protein
MSAGQAQQLQAIQNVASQSIQNGHLLMQMQQSFLAAPQLSQYDAITLIDPLGRKLMLPYTFFNTWEVSQAYQRLGHI